MKKNIMPRHLMTRNETTDYGNIPESDQPKNESKEVKEGWTSGEWQQEDKHVNESPTSEWFTRAITDQHSQRIALIYGDTEEEAVANSAIIQQAPSMYKALKEIDDMDYEGEKSRPYLEGIILRLKNIARNAYTKANPNY